MANEEKNNPERNANPERGLDFPRERFEDRRAGGKQEKRPLMTLDVRGEAKITDEKKHRESIAKFIPELNADAQRLSEELRADIKSVLPPDVDVELNVSFYPGSVDLATIVTLLGAANTALDVLTKSKPIISAIKLSVTKILRRQVGTRYPVKNVTVKVKPKGYSDPVHPLTRLLWWCSGSYREILRTSRTETVKYEGIGGAVLATGVLACLTGGYSAYTMFEWSGAALIIAPVLGLLWGALIFNLDRYIVATLKKMDWQNGVRRLVQQGGPAALRLALAVFIGITIAKPLELALFHSEVASRIQFNKDGEVKARAAELNAASERRVGELNGELERLRLEDESRQQRIETLRRDFSGEVDGTGGSRRYGYSVVAKEKQKLYEAARADYANWLRESEPARTRPREELDGIRKRHDEILAAYAQSLDAGFLRRLKALSDLTQAEGSVWLANIFIVGLLILIETLPVLLKLLAPFGPYDAKLNLKEEADISKAQARKNSLVEITERHYDNLTRAEMKVDEAFFDESVGVRIGKIGERYANWVNTAFDGKGETFEEFLDLTEESVFLNRKP